MIELLILIGALYIVFAIFFERSIRTKSIRLIRKYYKNRINLFWKSDYYVHKYVKNLFEDKEIEYEDMLECKRIIRAKQLSNSIFIIIYLLYLLYFIVLISRKNINLALITLLLTTVFAVIFAYIYKAISGNNKKQISTFCENDENQTSDYGNKNTVHKWKNSKLLIILLIIYVLSAIALFVYLLCCNIA